jgi:hypothetical protein
MRALVQPRSLGYGAVATVVTTLACYPRLALWPQAQGRMLFLLAVLAWASFFLWDFVFAWHEKYSRATLLQYKISGRLWLLATGCGIASALLMYLLLDPVMQRLTPEDYPHDLKMWAAMTIFALTLGNLFLCFSPFAFFVRLIPSVQFAIWGTIIFNLFVLARKMMLSTAPLSWEVLLALAALRIAATYLTLYFYLKGGLLLVSWWLLVLQMRQLLGL